MRVLAGGLVLGERKQKEFGAAAGKEKSEREKGQEQAEKRGRNPDQGGTRGKFSVNPVFPHSWMIFWLGYSVSLIGF